MIMSKRKMNLFNSTINILAVLLFAGLSNMSAQDQLAFPGAEGYGKYATGGRGNGETGRIVEVTNLEDDADNLIEGSLRWAFEQAYEDVVIPPLGTFSIARPITIVFRVGGVINLADELRVQRSNMTIAGETALGDGICIRGNTVNFSGSENVIVRHIRFRPGDESGDEVSAFRIENGENFIIDHCSMSWAIEETTHFSSNSNTTVQWCIISESLYNSIHKKGERGYAAQWGGQYATYHHNLLAHHNSRMPRINGSNENDVEALVDYRNNVNYNWGGTGAFYGGEWEGTNGLGFCHTNVVNNYFKPGPVSSSTFARPSLNRSGVELDGYAGWYFNGNVMEGSASKTADNWTGVDASEVGGEANIRSDVEFVQTDGVLEDYDNYTETAADAYESVLADVGATLPKRDAIDTRVIAETNGDISITRYEYYISGDDANPLKGVSSGIIDTQQNLVPTDDQATTTPWDVYESTSSDQAPTDTDHDGIPDDWEDEKGLDKNDETDSRWIASNGYSNFENYLYGLDDVNTSTHSVKSVSTSVIIYPNPVANYLYFDCSDNIAAVEIFSLQGQKIKSLEKTASKTYKTGSLNSGLYLVQTTFETGEVIVQKVMKK